MIRIGFAPILEHNLHLLRRYGVREIVINLHHKPEAIRDYFGDGRKLDLSIRYSYESELLGTAGALNPLRNFFDRRFLVMYGDNLSDCDLSAVYRYHVSQKAMCTMALFHRENVSQSGVADIGPEGRIRGFIEKPRPDEATSNWVSAGILLFEPEILDWIPTHGASDFGRDVLPALLHAGVHVAGYRMTEQLLWIDSPEDYRNTLRLLSGRDPRVAFLLQEIEN